MPPRTRGGTLDYTRTGITVTLDRPDSPRVARALTLLVDELNPTQHAYPATAAPSPTESDPHESQQWPSRYFRRSEAQAAVQPPSVGITAPLTLTASSEQSQTTNAEISCGVAVR